MKKCPHKYKKTRYKTELDAKIALASTQTRKDNWHRNECRVYYHRECKGWHLTSKPDRYNRHGRSA